MVFARSLIKLSVAAAAALALVGCYYQPPPVAYAPPAPGYYYAPAPAYYGPAYYGPSVGVGIGFGGGWHRHGWR